MVLIADIKIWGKPNLGLENGFLIVEWSQYLVVLILLYLIIYNLFITLLLEVIAGSKIIKKKKLLYPNKNVSSVCEKDH